eukprot:6012741-Pleurochrysis_carterae.AAC.1
MKRNSRSRKHQRARPRSQPFARACNVVQRPRSQMMLVSRRRQAPITKNTSSRGRRKPATQVLQPHRCCPPSRRSVRGPTSRAVPKGVGHAPQGNNH